MTSPDLIEYQLSGTIQTQSDIDKLNAIIIRHANSSDQMCKYFCTKILYIHLRYLQKLQLQKFLNLLKSFDSDSFQIISYE